MRVLLPEPRDGVDDVGLHDLYAAGWIADGGLRVNFVSSADGATHAQGTSAGLQTPGDNAVFATLRDLADVVLVGAGTAVTEEYRPLRPVSRRQEHRRHFGLADDLPVAVSSRSLRLDPTSSLFTEASGDGRTIVVTCDAAPRDVRTALETVADVEICGDESVEPALARAALERRGLTRILCEGGPTVLAEFAAAGVVDELCLSLSPKLVGPGAGRIVAGTSWADPRELTLTSLLDEDGALFLRYAVRPTPHG